MAVLIDEATGIVDLFDQLRDFLKNGLPTDERWTELQYDGSNHRMLLRAPGLSGTEEIHFGFDVQSNVAGDIYNLGVWMFKAYNAALGFYDQSGHSAVRYHLAWDSSTPFWAVANGQRLVLVTKVSTVYTATYVGKFLPNGTPGEYPQPYYIGAQASTPTRFSSTSENTRNFFDPSDVSSRVLHPSGVWWDGGNYRESSGESAMTSSAGYMWPFQAVGENVSTAVRSRYRELRENVDGSYDALPLILMHNNPAEDRLGELDGCFAVNGQAAASEDTADIDGDDHLWVQNVFRTARHYFAAVRLT